MKKYLYIIFLVFFASCAKNTELSLPNQDLNSYKIDNIYINSDISNELKNNFLNNYFSIWHKKNPKLNTKEISEYILQNNWFGANNQPFEKEKIEKLLYEANFIKANESYQNALIINSCDVRLLPTQEPLFLNPKLAGEGYPFDYLQNSYIYAYTPVKISHYSVDKAWVYVITNSYSGFVKSKNVALFNDLSILEKSKFFVMPKKDKIPLYDENNEFLEYARVGMMLSSDKKDNDFYYIKTFKKDLKNNAKLIISKVKKDDFINLGDSFSTIDIKNLANNLMGQIYGWGGLNANRDCSMFLKDLFASFGIFLERNSQAQIKQKNYKNQNNFIDLSSLNNNEKQEYIRKNAIPFATLLALKGHIVLYIGEFDDDILILHDFWGVKGFENNEETRIIVGKIAVTSISVGSELENVKKSDLIISKIYGMRNIF